MIQLLDRSWVDNSYGGLFEPFNVTAWEIDSVKHAIGKGIYEERLEREKAERKQERERARERERTERDKSSDGNTTETSNGETSTREPLSTVELYMKTMAAFQRSWMSFLEVLALPKYTIAYTRHALKNPDTRKSNGNGSGKDKEPKERSRKRRREKRDVVEGKELWFGLRSHYDLSPYGLDVVVKLWPVDE